MLDRMTPRQQAFALLMSLALLVFIVEMVRRRRLREEYSWLWILVAVAILVLSTWFGLLKWLTDLIGAVAPVSTFFVFGILFLMVINVYFSIKVSTLTTQVKNLAQRLAILDRYLQELRQGHSRQERGMPFAPGGDPWSLPRGKGDPTGEYQGQAQPAADASAAHPGAGPEMAAAGQAAGTILQGETGD